MAMVKVSVLWIGILIGLVFGNWVDGCEEILSFNETAMSFLDSLLEPPKLQELLMF